MSLESYIATNQSKYAVIGGANYDADPMAQSISSSPRRFILDGTEYVILSLDPASIAGLVEYIQLTGADVEYAFVKGSGKASLLTHAQAIELMAQADNLES